MTSHDQIDITSSVGRNLSISAVTAAGLALFIGILYIRPGADGPNSMISGRLGESAVIFGIIFFAYYFAKSTKDLKSSNIIVSIGHKGIFDRRISTGWIPWNAIHDISVVDHSSQKSLLFRLSQSEDAKKVLRRKMLDVVRNNASGTPQEFYVEARSLTGGFPCLQSAVTRFHEIV